jgi:hypothetical protein
MLLEGVMLEEQIVPRISTPWLHLRQMLISGMPHSLGVGVVTLHFFTSRKCSLVMSFQKVTHIVT